MAVNGSHGHATVISFWVNYVFTFVHLLDTFIPSDLHCIQGRYFIFYQFLAFTDDLGITSTLLFELHEPYIYLFYS